MFNHIRDLFAKLPAAKIRGYAPGRFSFNVKGGRCEKCEGDGVLKIEMNFLPPVYVTCEVCGGKRYNRETLEITYKGKNIADVLAMTVDEAVTFFRAVPQIYDPLLTLAEVGLGYIGLGQAATTLSGGEAQRVKLAAELSRKATGRTFYILDEPTTGLHFHDVAKLLEVLFKLRNTGNTLVVIEHNLDVIKTADWIIDLGPEGGDAGGRIVAQGPPEAVARCAESFTGQYLSRVLSAVIESTIYENRIVRSGRDQNRQTQPQGSAFDEADKLVEADKKTYAQVDVVGEDQLLDADAILVSVEGRADMILKDLEFVETRLGREPQEAERAGVGENQGAARTGKIRFQFRPGAGGLQAVAAHNFFTAKPIVVAEPADLENPDALLLRAFREAGYICFLTVGGKENRAWPIRKGLTAWEAGGTIHTDIQKGFIRAEIISYADFIAAGGETQAKRANKMRLETKQYVMQDYDLTNFRFNK